MNLFIKSIRQIQFEFRTICESHQEKYQVKIRTANQAGVAYSGFSSFDSSLPKRFSSHAR
jgi:uncharacterized protein YigE (DUF2233 family)